jgi:hypothetical protein
MACITSTPQASFSTIQTSSSSKEGLTSHLFHNSLANLYANGKTGTGMTVKSAGLLPKLDIHVHNSLL